VPGSPNGAGGGGSAAGSQGKHTAGVYAVSPQGPYEPAFGNLAPGFRDPTATEDPAAEAAGAEVSGGGVPGGSVEAVASEAGGVGDGAGGQDGYAANDPNGKAAEGEFAGSPPAGGYASADAARVGGGLYWHLLERLMAGGVSRTSTPPTLSSDEPSPNVVCK
jgi:hypothetical protein